jgi:predicted hotdog family 3-hydroxylacyl-ACP dehydratase
VPLDRAWIEQHIPHKGRMCLLDEVLSWDAARIRCRSGTHRASDNPLRSHGRLGAACGIEYAAQAMAVHGALVAASAPLERTVSSSVRGSIGPAIGYLASVRNVVLHVTRLDDLEADLIACAERITGDGRTVLYEFSVWNGDRSLLSGRASIVFDAAFGLPAAAADATGRAHA